MDEATTDDGTPSTIKWRPISPDVVSSPIVRQLPYFELKLEHPDLGPSGHNDRFFPDAVPYELDGVQRVFYWQPALTPSVSEPKHWELACATTHELISFDSLPVDGPSLVTKGARGTTLVVDGTIAGDATTSPMVASYSEPEVSIDNLSESRIELTAEGTEYSVPSGERRRIRLAEQCVEPGDGDGGSTMITPELVVRYPGQRTLHHPACRATYRLFPSFGLELNELPNPIPIPTTGGELDDAALATELSVDLSQRPYPERVLWQAFAYTTFDLHTDATPELTQLKTDHIVLRTGKVRTD